MDLDHSEFILQQKRRSEGDLSRGPNPKAILSALGFFALYVVCCIALAVLLDINKTTMLAAGLVFILTALVAFAVQKSLHGFSMKERERRLIREVMEGSRGARLITDGAGNTVYANDKFSGLCGGEEAGVKELAALFEENEDALTHFKTLAENAQRGLTDSIELSAGELEKERWFMVTAQPVAGWAGYVHWRVDDITSQRELDRTIREEREKLIDFTDNAPVGFFSVDEHGRFLFVNATLARWLGSDIERLLTRGDLHTYLEKPPKGAKPYDITDKGGARQVAELMMKGPAGKTFLASVSQTVVVEESGRVRTRGVVHDLTIEREMKQALEASEDRFERFFEEAPLGILLVGDNAKIEDCNTAMAAMLGEEMEVIEGKAFRDILSEDDRDSVLFAMNRIGQGEQMSAPMEIILQAKDKPVSVQMHARRFKGSDNIVLHFIDLTDQKTLEAQFIQSQKMQAVGQLAGGVAHDFNNLLTAIIGFSDLLLQRHKPGDPSFSDIMQIKQNSNRAANLVRQLLAFSRQQTLRPQVQDISDILAEVSNLIRRLIGANIELDLVYGQDVGMVKVDAGQMEQVFINLAVNARDAMEDGGKLTMTTSPFENRSEIKYGEDVMPPGRWVKIDVSDTGCGIPEENLSRIFEPFFTTKDVGQGTGLGLATVYGIIRQTGGFLDVNSAVDKGTVFSVYLPALSEAEVEAAKSEVKHEEQKESDLTGNAKILLVEDEDAVRMFSTRALTNKGYEVLGAEHGEAALALLEKEDLSSLDLLITDVMMPGIDGPTLARKLREQQPDLKIVFISGYTEDKLKDEMGEGIYFLPKPFTLKQLAAKIKEVLDD